MTQSHTASKWPTQDGPIISNYLQSSSKTWAKEKREKEADDEIAGLSRGCLETGQVYQARGSTARL